VKNIQKQQECGLAICIKKYLKAKEDLLWKCKIFHHAKIQSSKKNLKKIFKKKT
jgi:hypothetical protein